MSRVRQSRAVVVGVLIACVLCALLPVSMSSSRVVVPARQEPAAHEHEDYRCADHRCGCVDAVACRSACCCDDGSESAHEEIARSHGPLLDVLRCRGGLPASVAMSAFNAVIATPCVVAYVREVRVATLLVACDAYVSWKPDPRIPPPRAA